MITELEKQALELLAYLEEYWRMHYPELKLHEHLTDMLHAARQALAQDSDDARLIIAYSRSLKHEIKPAELKKANTAVKRLLKSLGLMTVSLMPLSFITLPGLFALAHYFNINLLPENPGQETGRHKKSSPSTHGS